MFLSTCFSLFSTGIFSSCGIVDQLESDRWIRISPKDLVLAAGSMIRRTLLQGEILYYKGDSVKSIYLVVSGEFYNFW